MTTWRKYALLTIHQLVNRRNDNWQTIKTTYESSSSKTSHWIFFFFTHAFLICWSAPSPSGSTTTSTVLFKMQLEKRELWSEVCFMSWFSFLPTHSKSAGHHALPPHTHARTQSQSSPSDPRLLQWSLNHQCLSPVLILCFSSVYISIRVPWHWFSSVPPFPAKPVLGFTGIISAGYSATQFYLI